MNKLTIEDYVFIGHLNIIWRLDELNMEAGSCVSHMNWITGGMSGFLNIGRNSTISRRHLIDASAGVEIGANTIVAGIGSQFFTHGHSPDPINVRKKIVLGDWCFVGSAVRFTPGSGISDHTFVGMGAVVARCFEENHVLVAGVPAKVMKELSPDDEYFDRPFIQHFYHPAGYSG